VIPAAAADDFPFLNTSPENCLKLAKTTARISAKFGRRTPRMHISTDESGEERFRHYFELGLIGMAITSPTKGMIEVNDEICKILGTNAANCCK
jgi:hypothetical protein